MDYGQSTLGVCRKNKLYFYKEIKDWVDDETEKIGLAVAGGFAVVGDRPLSKYQRRGDSWNSSTDAVTGHMSAVLRSFGRRITWFSIGTMESR